MKPPTQRSIAAGLMVVLLCAWLAHMYYTEQSLEFASSRPPPSLDAPSRAPDLVADSLEMDASPAASSPRVLNASRSALLFMYDWPSECYALKLCRSPTLQAAMEAQCEELKSIEATRRSNAVGIVIAKLIAISVCSTELGYGPLLSDASRGVEERNTHLYAPALLFSARLYSSKWRTVNASEARLFYIPYDSFTDFQHFDFKLRPETSVIAAKRQWLLTKVVKSPQFRSNLGTDHFLVDGINRHFSQAGLLFDDLLANVTKLSVENFPYRKFEYDSFGRSVHRAGGTIPYPSYIHPRLAAGELTWDPCAQTNKTMLVSAAFSTGTISASVNSQRQALLEDCAQHPSHCLAVNISTLDRNKAPLKAIVDAYKASRFCFVPPGDAPTSKRFFDALVSCCMPVLTSRSLQMQYRSAYSFVFADIVDHFTQLIMQPSSRSASSLASADGKELPFVLSLLDAHPGGSGAFFNRSTARIAEELYGLTYALAEHDTLFDAVDLVVRKLLQPDDTSLLDGGI